MVEMDLQLRGLGLFALIVPKVKRSEVKQLRADYERITSLVDRFYALLGPRNWVFTDDLNLDAVEQIVDTSDPAEAEARLLTYLKGEERISFPAGRLRRFEQMRPRMDLVERARQDYAAERYYCVVLVLLAVMDGFVNDFEKDRRKGLHSRAVEEMTAWDSVVGHHLGLSHAHKTFTRTFKKLDTSAVTELYRNGIVHGMLTNFDNEVVAAKAWNRLFAVADWADSRVKEQAPVEVQPTWKEMFAKLQSTSQTRKLLDEWTQHEYEATSIDSWGVIGTCQDFLRRWRDRQWAPLGEHFIRFGTDPVHKGKLAIAARSLYEDHVLTDWDLSQVRHTGAAAAEVYGLATINGERRSLKLRWVRVSETDDVACEWEPGRWVLSPTYPESFTTEDDAQEL